MVQTLDFAAETVYALGKDFFAGWPEVAAGGPAAVGGRDVLTPGALGGTISHKARHDLARLATERDPDPAGVRLGADKAPKLVQFQHHTSLDNVFGIAPDGETYFFGPAFRDLGNEDEFQRRLRGWKAMICPDTFIFHYKDVTMNRGVTHWTEIFRPA